MRAFIASNSKRKGMDKGERKSMVEAWYRSFSVFLCLYYCRSLFLLRFAVISPFLLIQGIMMLAWERRRNEVAVLISCF